MKIIVVDIETAGLSKEIDFNRDLIVEIGIVGLDLETGKKKIIYDELVNQGITERHKDSWCFKNTSIKYGDVLRAKPIDIQRIQFLMDNYMATAYNKRFDFSFLSKFGLKINELPCPMLLCTDICKIPPTERMRLYRPDIKYKTPSAQEAYDFFFPESKYKESHRAADDALHEAAIVYELYKRNIFKTN